MSIKISFLVTIFVFEVCLGYCSKDDKVMPQQGPQQGPPPPGDPNQIQFDPNQEGPPPPENCQDILKQSPFSLSGMFVIKTKGGPLQVYCDMNLEGGGWTFIPRFSVRPEDFVGVELDKIVKDKSKVLLRFWTKSGTQPYTLIEQLPENKKHDLGIFKNSYKGYSKPENVNLGAYLYLGIIPKKKASKKTKQGFLSNGKPITFENCDGKPNSHFAFLPNHYEKEPSNLFADDDKFEKSGLAVEWRKSGKRVTSFREMPNDFFFFTEMHFGGCGCYTSSDRWDDALGVAIGFR